MRITNGLATWWHTAQGHLAATLPPQPAPGSLAKPLVERLIWAAIAAPGRTQARNVASLRSLAPALVNDVLYEVADWLGPEGVNAVEAINYERSSGPLREQRLHAYATQIGLGGKPQAMMWSRYVAHLYAKAAWDRARDRVLLDLAWGNVTPDQAVQWFPDDTGVVHMAVKLHGYALKHASARLQADFAIASTAVRQNGYAVAFVHNSLCARRDFARIAVRSNGYALGALSEALRDDEVIVGIAVDKHGEAIQYASDRWRADPAMAARALRQTKYARRFLHPSVQSLMPDARSPL